jgi:hypothetical protein
MTRQPAKINPRLILSACRNQFSSLSAKAFDFDLMMRIRSNIESKLLTWIRKVPISEQAQARFLFVVCWLLPIYCAKWFLTSLFTSKSASTTRPADPRTRTLTFSLLGEGIGGQFTRYVTGRQVAQILDLTFVHCPFERNFHCPEIDWDEFLGFADLHQESFSTSNSVRTVNLPDFDLTTNRNLQLLLLKLITKKIHWQDHVHFVLSFWSWAPPEADPELAASLFSSLRSQYLAKRLTEPLPGFSEQSKVRVTVIVRRGEIVKWRESGDYDQKSTAKWRWVEIDWYLEVLQSMYTELGEANIECHVFSDVSDRSQLESLLIFPGMTLHTKDEPRQPLLLFNSIVESDVTVCGLTGICYAAGVLGTAIMIVPPNEALAVYFPDGERWIKVHGQTGGEHDRLDTALKSLKAQKDT